MKKEVSIFLTIAVVAVVGYGIVQLLPDKTDEGVVKKQDMYGNAELGFSFVYPTGANGYVLEERDPLDIEDIVVRTVTLMRSEDYANIKNIPIGSEGPPVISVMVVKNDKKQPLRTWAESAIAFSNIHLKTTDVVETTINGIQAIRYMADGLYASDTAVVIHGEYAYVFTGQFLDAQSDLRNDFQPLLDSVRFIPKTN